jgi:putative peptide-modifying radical SAM enzyme
MYFHLILTDDCNLCCSYCRAKAFGQMEQSEGERALIIDEDLPPELDFDLNELYDFLKKDPLSTLTFYGGEPLLRTDLIERIVREAPIRRFMMQTNGILLDRLPPETVNRFVTILVSLDGRKELTDGNRGHGVYDQVIENIRKIREHGYNGELIARMTVTERTDIVEAVHHLASSGDCSFSSIHWQIDANFTGDFSLRRFREWARYCYNPGIWTLVDDWIDHMKAKGEVLRWYPFLDPMEDLLYEKESRLRCGSGYANYTIMTDGNIGPCPVMVGMSQYYVGHISWSDPLKLDHVLIRGECADCSIRSFCGGRCLYSNITQPWGIAERRIVCETVENLRDALVSALPRVQKLMDQGTISPGDFTHEKFNGCEIIP